MSVVGHLLGGLRRAIGRVLLWFLIFGIIGAAVVELVSLVETGHGPGLFTNITAAVVGVVVGYAAGLTVVVAEVIHFVVDAAKEAAKGVESDVGQLGGIVGEVGKVIEKHI